MYNKKASRVDHILFEDESMIRDYQAIEKTWFLKGKQRIISTYGKHEGVKDETCPKTQSSTRMSSSEINKIISLL